MTETLVEIDNSPTSSERLATIKKWLIEPVLLPEQKHASFNSTPYFMIVILILRLVLLVHALITHWYYVESYPLVFGTFFIGIFVVHIFLGLPLEIAHGTLQMTAFYLFSTIYPHIVGELILSKYDFLDMDSCPLALVGLHLANIVKNWSHFPRKYIHILFLFIFGVLFEIWFFKYNFIIWQTILYRFTCGIAGFLYGILTGYFWIYRNKEEDKPETAWRSFSIVLTCLVVYLIVVELSGFHMTFEELMQELKKGRITI